jgi:hypothetical protein
MHENHLIEMRNSYMETMKKTRCAEKKLRQLASTIIGAVLIHKRRTSPTITQQPLNGRTREEMRQNMENRKQQGESARRKKN